MTTGNIGNINFMSYFIVVPEVLIVNLANIKEQSNRQVKPT